MAGYEYVTADGSEWFRDQRWEPPIQWGFITLEVLEAMAERPPTDGSRRWVASDYNTLDAAVSLEGELRFFGLPNGSSNEVVDGLHGFVDEWHGALPFAEQERIAVYNLRLQSRSNIPPTVADAPTLPELLRTTELELIRSGVRKAVRGRDLLQRWWEWRRSVGEFEGQDSYEEATKALGRMTARLLERSVLPHAYDEVMGLESSGASEDVS